MNRGRWYILSIVWLALLFSLLLAGMLDWSFSKPFLGSLWILGFFLIALNLSYLLHGCVLAGWIAPASVQSLQIEVIPDTAILYVVRNEDPKFVEQMAETYSGNREPGIDLWLISNSDQANMLRRECAMVVKLISMFPGSNIRFYQSANNPLRRKHVAIRSWAAENLTYQYMIVCDADTVLPTGTVRRLVEKAEHPTNRNVVAFQSHLQIGRSRTRFAAFLEPGQNLAHRAFCRINYAIFGTSPYYGHGALLRRGIFSSFRIDDHVLSHDIWESAAIDKAGGRIAYCDDVEVQEMFPSDFIEFRRRSRRWIQGTIEAMPLLGSRNLSTGIRFHLALAGYIYLVQPIFLGWVLLGLLAYNTHAGPMLRTQSIFLGGVTAIDLEMGGFGLATMGLVWAYKIRFCSSFQQVLLVLRDVLTGTAVLLNNLFYETWYVLSNPWTPRTWLPMQKKPSRKLSLRRCMYEMRASILFGVFLVVAGTCLNRQWLIYSSPILLSFLLGGLTVYWTSKPAGKRGIANWEPI